MENLSPASNKKHNSLLGGLALGLTAGIIGANLLDQDTQNVVSVNDITNDIQPSGVVVNYESDTSGFSINLSDFIKENFTDLNGDPLRVVIPSALPSEFTYSDNGTPDNTSDDKLIYPGNDGFGYTKYTNQSGATLSMQDEYFDAIEFDVTDGEGASHVTILVHDDRE